MSTLGHDIRSKQPHRDALDRDVQEYLRKGGTVEVLETCVVSSPTVTPWTATSRSTCARAGRRRFWKPAWCSTAATEDDEEDGP